jgi:hypothetical protein
VPTLRPVRHLVLLAALVLPVSSFGAFHFSVHGFGGFASSTVPNGFASPSLIQGGVGLSAGLGFSKRFYLGAATDYRWMGQLSAVTNGSGNRRGERWNQLSPALFLFLGKVLVQLEAQILGEYRLTNLTPEGARVIYKSPLGAKVTFGFPLSRTMYLGFFAESVLFRKQTVTEEKVLHPPLNLWQTGLQLAWVPGRPK